MVVSASSSSSTFIVPISAAKALPERPASTTAVMRGPNSRKRAMVIMSATYTSAPKRCSVAARVCSVSLAKMI